MRSALIAAFVWLGACHSTLSIQGADVTPVMIAADVTLNLPASPGDLPAASSTQTLIARHGEKTQALTAIVETGPAQVYVLLTAANGPRVMEINWTEGGIDETRYAFTPDALSGLNILSDIYISFWPLSDVKNALSGSATAEDEDTLRTIARNGETIITIEEIKTDAPSPRQHHTLTNTDRGYTLDIFTTPSPDTGSNQ